MHHRDQSCQDRAMQRPWLSRQRTIILVTLLVSGVIGPRLDARSGAEERKRAIAAIEKLGGSVTRDEMRPGEVIEVYLSGPRVTDAALTHLSVLPHLLSLDLSESQITDGGLAHLRGLSRLQWLDLSETRI